MRKIPSPISFPSKKKVIAFGWYGGKFSHLNWLLPILPKCHHYIEPFSGSASVLLNRDPSPLETYNDLDHEVVTFFRVLRDNPEELIRKIGLTPFSRQEFMISLNIQGDLDDIEKARRFFVRAKQVRSGLAQVASLGRWANCKNTSRDGMANKVAGWLNGQRDLAQIAERLLRVQIENRSAIELINLYDSANVLFYCDPPYLMETRSGGTAYGYEMTEDEHRDLSRVLNSVKAKVVISGYDCDKMTSFYPEDKWFKHIGPSKCAFSCHKIRQECCWTNFQ